MVDALGECLRPYLLRCLEHSLKNTVLKYFSLLYIVISPYVQVILNQKGGGVRMGCDSKNQTLTKLTNSNKLDFREWSAFIMSVLLPLGLG